MDIRTILFISMSLIFGYIVYLIRAEHQQLWKRFGEKYNLRFYPGQVKFGQIEIAKDRLKGIYRGRKLSFVYYVLYGRNDIWRTQIQLTAKVQPKGNFILGQTGLFTRRQKTTGDRYFDRHVIVIKERPRGYVSQLLSESDLRERIARFLANPWVMDRRISQTPTGRIKLQESSLFLSEKRLLDRLDLLTDLAVLVEQDQDTDGKA